MPSQLTRLLPRALRALERFARTAWLRLWVRLLGREGGVLPPDEHVSRVLFIRYDRLGDMILCTGILRAIAGAHPNITIDVVTAPQNTAALAELPFVGEVLVHQRGRWSTLPSLLVRLWGGRYDVVIDGLVGRP